MTNPLELNASNFETEVLQSTIPVLVDFWAPWCGPCRMMAPVLEQLATEFEGKIKITKLNVDLPEHQLLAHRYKVQGIPNLQLFKGGNVIQEYVGFRPADHFAQELAQEL
ncbi:MAG: thioredoxin 1 [Patescibacteria group bacterium]|jgi:thioredoxin 1|nr:thioredoxin 1 [Patescibacteria group bacterium]